MMDDSTSPSHSKCLSKHLISPDNKNIKHHNYENIDLFSNPCTDSGQNLVKCDAELILESPSSYHTAENVNVSIADETEWSNRAKTSYDSWPTTAETDDRSVLADDATIDEGDSLTANGQLGFEINKELHLNNENFVHKENSTSSEILFQKNSNYSLSLADISSVNSIHSERNFFCREWVWAKLWACLEQRLSSKTNGVLIVGGPGTGKTALCTQLINSNGIHGRHANLLQNRLLAHHFCYSHDAFSINVASFIQSLVIQFANSEFLKNYSSKVAVDEVVQALDPLNLQKDPDEAFRKAILFPLLEHESPDGTLILLVDSIDEDPLINYSGNDDLVINSRTTGSRSIMELLSNHHHLLPQWLLLVVTARKSNHLKSYSRTFSGFRKISLDDLRRSHVVRDVQQYILSRLDTEPALRCHLSRETAEMLNQLHIKSNACFLYLEKVLDGVAENWVTLREIRDIPGTLNGLYLWLCQRLYPRKHFQRVLPFLSIILASRKPLTQIEIQNAIKTHIPNLSQNELNKRWALLQRVMCPYTRDVILLFHNSFSEWLLDVKHCTQKYLVDTSLGHLMIAMKLTINASKLSPQEVQTFAFHLSRIPIKGSLQPSHLPLWLLASGASLENSLNFMPLEDASTLKLLCEAGAEAKSQENLLEDSDSTESFDLNNSDNLLTKNNASNFETYESILETKALNDFQNLSLDYSNKYESKNGNKLHSHDEECIRPKTYDSHLPVQRYAVSEHSSHSSRNSCYKNTGSDVQKNKNDNFQNEWNIVSTTDVQNWEKPKEDPLYPYLRGGHIDAVDDSGRTLLHTAAHQGDASLVGLLLQRGAKHSLKDQGGQMPLNLASRQGHNDVVIIILSHGANSDHADDDGWTSLRSAAWGGHVDVVESLLNGGAHADLADIDGRTALRAAAWGGHEDIVATLLESGADVNKADSEGRTPLIAAAYMGHWEIVSALILGGADVNHSDKDGRTALSVGALCAASFVTEVGVPTNEGRLQVVTALLEGGANVNHQDKDGLTPLLVAAFEGHVDVCELLLEYDADVDHVDRSGRTPLLAAASMGHASVVEKLLFWGCYVDHIDVEGRTVLSIAAAQGSLDTVRLLLNRGLDETHRDNAGWTPLHYAAFEGHRDVCMALFESGARVNEVDNDGKHALVLSAQEGHADVVGILLDYGASLHHASHDGRSALRVAALEGHKNVVHLLLCRGADICYRDADGRSTLYLLALEDQLIMAAFLLENGADVESRDLEGRTPLHVTSWQGHIRMVELLLSHGANVDAEDNEQRTPLQSAAWQGNAAIVGILLHHGARAGHACSQGATALSIAAQEGHEECVMLLLRFGADTAHADKCGRTAVKVALKGGHLNLAKLLEDHLEKEKVIAEIDQSKNSPSLVCLRINSSPNATPVSTSEKRKSFLSLGGRSSSKSSCNLSSSTRSSAFGGVGPPPPVPLNKLICDLGNKPATKFSGDHVMVPTSQNFTPQYLQQLSQSHLGIKPPPLSPAPSVPFNQSPILSFTQQLQQCGRIRKRKKTQLPQGPLTPLDDSGSPIYVSPPITPPKELPPLPSRANPLVALLESDYAMPCQNPTNNPRIQNAMNNRIVNRQPEHNMRPSVPVHPMFSASRNAPNKNSTSCKNLSIKKVFRGKSSSGKKNESSGLLDQNFPIGIILGNRSPECKPKRNVGVSNPSLKAAQAKASSLFKNTFTGRSKNSSVKLNGLNFKRETPL